MECVELAPAFEPRHTSDSGSKLHALHTLRETRPPLSSVYAICSVSPENLRKKTRFSPILFTAPPYTPDHNPARSGQTRPTRFHGPIAMNSYFSAGDWGVIVAYLLGIIGLGVWFGR